MRRNKLTIISATFILLHRVLSVAARRTRKVASRGATTVHDWSIWFRKTLSCHRRGSGAADRRRDHYCPVSIISPSFSIEFRLRHNQHSQRRRGSGRPLRCWRDTFGAQFSFSPTWDTMFVPGTPSSVTRSTKLLTGVQSRICFRN